MNIEELTIRKYQKGDEERISEFLRTVFSDVKGRDYWKWQYKDNPAGFFSNIWVAEHNNKIVSYYALIPVKIRVGKVIILGAQSLDTVTHPDYRRMGLFYTLGKKAVDDAINDGIHITFGYPGTMSYGGFIKIGWKDVLFVPKHFKIINLTKALNYSVYGNLIKSESFGKSGKAIKTLCKAFSKQTLSKEETYYVSLVRNTLMLVAGMISSPFVFFHFSNAPEVKDVKFNRVDCFDERIDTFWNKVAQQFDIVVDRNKEYLNWKYAQNPLDNYAIFIAETEAEIVGYIVLACKGDEGCIIDILSLEDGVFQFMINQAEVYFRAKNVGTVQCWMVFHHKYAKLLKNSGYFSYRSMATIFRRLVMFKGVTNPLILYFNSPLDYNASIDLLDQGKWFIALGDKA